MTEKQILKVIIVDDEPLARDKIAGMLKMETDIEIVAECASGQKAVAAVQKHAPDILFLDVQMPTLDGFGVLKSILPQNLPYVIFVTALRPICRARIRSVCARLSAEAIRPSKV